MKIFIEGKEIKEYKCQILADRNGNPVFQDSKVKIFTDLIGDDYDLPREIIICEIIWENGGFHALNIQTEEQFPLWQLRGNGIEVINAF